MELGHDVGVHHDGAEEIFKHVAVDVVLGPDSAAEEGELERHEHVERPADPRVVGIGAGHDQEDEPEDEERKVDAGVELGQDGTLAKDALANLEHADEGREDGLRVVGEALGDGVASGGGGVGGTSLVPVEDVEGAGGEQVRVADIHVAAVNLESAPDGGAHEADSHRERQTRDDGDSLDGAEGVLASVVARAKERDGDGALGPAPENLLADGGVGEAVGGDDVIDVGARVGGGDEVEGDADEEETPEELLDLLVGRHQVEHGVTRQAKA